MTYAAFLRRACLLCVVLLAALAPLRAQEDAGKDDALSQKEVDELRDAAYIPGDRIFTYQKILDAREKSIEALLGARHHVNFGPDIHDLMSQVAAIADELNDNLDDLGEHHRDLRKVLPKLGQATERWATTLRTPPKDDAYDVARKLALAAVGDTHQIVAELTKSQAEYFLQHPDAARRDKELAQPEHAPVAEEPSH